MKYLIKMIQFPIWLVFLVLFCKNPTESRLPPIQKIDRQDTILALGDSYTIGQSVAVEARWPNQLVQQLRNKKWMVADPKIIARTGWTTLNLRQAIEATPLAPPYELVTLLIGVNDQFQGRGLENYRSGFCYLLNKSIELAGGNPQRVVVLSIPDYSVTPFGKEFNPEKIRAEIDQFNALNFELSKQANVHYVDITPISRRAEDEPDLLAVDQLHPSGKMYAEWVKLLLPLAEAILSEKVALGQAVGASSVHPEM